MQQVEEGHIGVRVTGGIASWIVQMSNILKFKIKLKINKEMKRKKKDLIKPT